MIASISLFARLLCSVILCSSLLAMEARAQGNQPSTQEGEDVLRIKTELVQTGVLVLDKQGRFVDNLKGEQFELRVDGKPQAISFFERVRTGSANEEAQLAAARGIASTSKGASAIPLDRGRTLIFFIDDVHLSADSLARSRKVVQRFIDEEMGTNDQAIVASTSGQIGFLQQLTNNKAVLRAALARLNFRQYIRTKGEFPEITEYQAFAIQERNDQQLFDFFVGEVLRDDVLLKPEIAQTIVRNRVQMIVNQSNFYVQSALASLESFMRSSSQIPGRKLFYFISDGFLLNIKSGNVVERMRHITDAALRSGAVIYSIDARGLSSEPIIDASRQSFDLRGVQALRSFGDLTATQEPLHILAEDTGGRALLNNNALGSSISQAVKETSAYYLLAWRPEGEQQQGRGNKFRQIEASIKERPDLKVLLQRGYFDTPPADTPAKPSNAKNKKAEAKPAAASGDPTSNELMSAVVSQLQQTALPTSLFVGYTKEPRVGMILTASVEINDDRMATRDATKPAQSSVADLLGVILNDQGKVINSFKQQLSITPADEAAKQRHLIVTSQKLPIAPGLYQIRVSARDRLSGRTGSDAEWIEIPDPTKNQLSLSSLFIGERTADEQAQDSTGAQVVVLNPNRRFARNSRLRFHLQIYNASNPASPDVAVQIQVFRDDQPVVTTAMRKVKTEGLTDLTQIPYAAEVLLDKLPAGHYVLRVTTIDRIAKASAAQQVDFAIE